MEEQEQMVDNVSTPLRHSLVVLVWNCRGLGNKAAMNAVRDLIEAHHPDIVILTKTRMARERVDRVARQLQFDGFKATETIDFSGGILLLWNEASTKVQTIGSTEQELHTIIGVSNFRFKWLLSSVYASPRSEERDILWRNLEVVAENCNLPWAVMGDFIELLMLEEKLGGRTFSRIRADRFAGMMSACELSDLGFIGPKFTWTNMRSSGGLIQEILDRVLVNAEWREAFPEVTVTHLPRTHSDHCPLRVDFNPRRGPRLERPFRCETMWVDCWESACSGSIKFQNFHSLTQYPLDVI